MSMIAEFSTASDSNIRRMIEDPPLVWQLVAPDDPDIYQEARSASRKKRILSRLFRKTRAPKDTPEDLDLRPGEGSSTDLDKSWHGLHYLFTGTAWEGEPPLNFLVSGGQQIGDLDVGYGPARAFATNETAAINGALKSLSANQLRDRFDPSDMNAKEIYPQIWPRDPGDDDALGYLLGYLAVLKTYLDQTVESRLGVVIWLS